MAGILQNETSVEPGGYPCKFCNKVSNSMISYLDHIRSKDHYKMIKHAEKKNKAELLQKFRELQNSNTERSFISKTFICPECGKHFTSWTNADDHFRSSQHIKKISENEMELTLFNMKPKIEASIKNVVDHRRASKSSQDSIDCATKQPAKGSNVRASKEAVANCNGNIDIKDKGETGQERPKKFTLKKMRIQAGEAVSGNVVINSLNKEILESMESALKEHDISSRLDTTKEILKHNTIKGCSRKTTSKIQKGQVERAEPVSNNDEMVTNEMTKSNKGIAYFLPNEPTKTKTLIDNKPSSNRVYEKHRNSNIGTKQKDMMVSRKQDEAQTLYPRKAKIQIPEDLRSISGNDNYYQLGRNTRYNHLGGTQKQSNVSNTKTPLAALASPTKGREWKKRYQDDMEIRNLSIKNNEILPGASNDLKKGCNQNNKVLTAVGIAKTRSNGKPSHHNSNPKEDNHLTSRNTNQTFYRKKSESLSSMQESKSDSKYDQTNQSAYNEKDFLKKTAFNKSPFNTYRIHKQCEKCGHVCSIDKEEIDIFNTFKSETDGSKLTSGRNYGKSNKPRNSSITRNKTPSSCAKA